MKDFVFTGGTLTDSVILGTGCINENDNFSVLFLKTGTGGPISVLPSVMDDDFLAIVTAFPLGWHDLGSVKALAKARGLNLTREGAGVSEVLVGPVLSGLDVDKVLFRSGNVVRYVLDGAVSLSPIPSTGTSKLVCKGNGKTVNDGTFVISAVSNGAAGGADSKYIEVSNPARSNNAGDEGAGAPGTCDVITG